MSAAIMGTPYSPSSPTTNSSDTTSPVYPDRPIRPLPKRPLRSRLSPEVAESIKYPPTPNTSSLFYPYSHPAYSKAGPSPKAKVAEIDKALIEAQKTSHESTQNGYQFRGSVAESDDEDSIGISQQRQMILSTPSRGYTNGVNRTHESIAPSVSSHDSVDGYDSFENTNNKKKRKIPISGSLGSHHSSLSAEMANMDISPSRDIDSALHNIDGSIGQYCGAANSGSASSVSGTGISGAGRGRYGRSGRRDISGRSPLGVSTNASNAWQQGRLSGSRREYTSSGYTASKALNPPPDQGIISAAIAEAAALPSALPQGQENTSLLERSTAKKLSPAKTQFTFTCEADSTKGVNWPIDPYPPPPGPSPQNPPLMTGTGQQQTMNNQRGFSTQGTQTSPTMAGQANQNGAGPANNAQANPQPARKPRRPAGKRYAMAARERRLQQEYNNYHHPPREEDVWICEFCEYESIFGSPPEALVRQYEIKDRRERKRLAEKRRLLEKAKMKGRKGKKGNKNAAKNNAATTQAQQQPSQQDYQQPVDTPSLQNNGTQSEEYFGDDFYDDPMPMPAPPPQAPTKIPQPITQHYGQSVRTAHGSGMGAMREREVGRVA